MLLLTCSLSLSHVGCLWQGITWDALLFPFHVLYILLCIPSSSENKTLRECLTGSFSFSDLFYDLKEVSLGPSLLSVLNVALRVTPSHCRCTQTSWLSKFTHRTQSIPNAETLCLSCPPPLPPPREGFNFTSKLCFSLNFGEWFTCFMVKIVLQI